MNFENRKIGIESSLRIENLLSTLLKYIIGILMKEDTKTLDNKSSSLSFKAKADMLFDCERIDKKTYSNLLHIMSIRNQFAHNFNCETFEDLSIQINGINKVLLKYDNSNSPILELQLKTGFQNMFDEVLETLKVELEPVIEEYDKSIKNKRNEIDKIYNDVIQLLKLGDDEDVVFRYKGYLSKIIEDERNSGDPNWVEKIPAKVKELQRKRVKELEKEIKKKMNENKADGNIV